VNEGPDLARGSAPNQAPAPKPSSASRQGPHIGPVPITLPLVLVVLVLVGSLIFIGWVAASVHDNQIPLLAVGFVAFGAGCVALAVGSLLGMWHAASRSESGRATALAIVGGLAGLAAIGSFTIAALLTMVLNT
jgi:hypothetical protein